MSRALLPRLRGGEGIPNNGAAQAGTAGET